jgi:hypothetical protein
VTQKDKNKLLAKSLFIANHSIEQIAKILCKTVKTIQNYKAEDKDWDNSLISKHIPSEEKNKEELYKTFIQEMHLSIKQIRLADLKPGIKADKIAKLGDAFSKMSKIAAISNPEDYKISIIKKTIENIINIAKETLNDKELYMLVDAIQNKQEELTDVSI